MIRNLPIAHQELSLVAAGPTEPVQVWAEENGRRVLTDRVETDETTGHPLWTVYAMSAAGGRPEVIQVRVPAQHQPVLTVFGRVDFDGLEVRVVVGKDGKLGGYWSARGVSDPAQTPGRRNGQEKHEPVAA